MVFPFQRVVFGSIFTMLTLYYQKYEDLDREMAFPTGASVEKILPSSVEYDFIIVGGGTAGSVVANKLSLEYNVLLLEIGGDPLPQTYVPGNFAYNWNSFEAAHNWTCIPQKHSCLGNNGLHTIQQGKALGGTTTVNAQQYNRGHPLDWDNFAKIAGDESWAYENMVKYFKMNENFYQDEYSDHIGFGGPMQLCRGDDTFNDIEKSWVKAWKDGSKEIGYDWFENSNAPQVEGFGMFSLIKREGRRYSAYEAFLKPILHRHTLTIHRYSEAKMINIDENGQAVGVFYKRHGIEQYATAKKEVIVSAGTFNSPLLLMRSGIGPSDQLKEGGIEVRSDIPVGKFFSDHPGLWFSLYKIPEEKDPYYGANQTLIDLYLNEGKGPLGNILGIMGQAFVTSKVSKETTPDVNWPDIQLHFNYNSSVIYNGDGYLKVFVSIARPYSAGNFKLDTSDPHEKPLIWDPNYLADDRDIKVVVEGMHLTYKLLQTNAFRAIGGSIDETPLPACASKKFATDDYWECLVRQLTKNIWHPVGSCRMGQDSNSEAVVTSELKVKGVKGLRVIDNSIMPAIPDGNTMAPALVIGQKGSAMIMEEYRQI